jgi:uncharacterized protein YbjT (DUF2867 family)
MTAPILVTGGTGTLGRLVVPRLLETGRGVRVLSRRVTPATGGIEFVTGDLATGDGIERAVRGAETILHLAGSSKGDEVKARHLIEAAQRAGSPHVVFISVVGADKIPVSSAIDRAMFGYIKSKLEAEQAVAESGLPWTTLRATQFHDLIFMTVAGMSKMPVVPVPAGFRFQPIDADEVAARLVELALDEPAGYVPDMGGPRIYSMQALVRSYLAATGKHRALFPLRLPGKAARAFRAGANLAPDRAVGRRNWEDFLATRAKSPNRKSRSPEFRSDAA